MIEILIFLILFMSILYIIRINFPNQLFIIPRELNMQNDLSVIIVGFNDPKLYLKSFVQRHIFSALTVIEPDPLRQKSIYDTMADKRFNLICAALVPFTETQKSVTLYRHKNKCSLFYPVENLKTNNIIQSRALNMDQLLKYHNVKCKKKIDVIVLNVSGAEYIILKSWLSSKSLRRRPRFILFDKQEMMNSGVLKFNTICALLDKHNYTHLCNDSKYLKRFSRKKTMVAFTLKDNTYTY